MLFRFFIKPNTSLRYFQFEEVDNEPFLASPFLSIQKKNQSNNKFILIEIYLHILIFESFGNG
jgi:hypothetical protein